MDADLVNRRSHAIRDRGFTLIELMIVLAVIGVLAAMAFQGYEGYMVRASRSAAQQFMVDLASLENAFLLDARSYTATVGAGGLNATVPTDVSRFYAVAITVNATPPAFTVTATPVAGTRQASDGVLTLNSAGVKTPTGKW